MLLHDRSQLHEGLFESVKGVGTCWPAHCSMLSRNLVILMHILNTLYQQVRQSHMTSLTRKIHLYGDHYSYQSYCEVVDVQPLFADNDTTRMLVLQ